ncbi:MAG TPA: hypothetical protein VLM85_29225 [Polyangiaceae bacterium]|nr:hypothetical protein [Polyangiaceae bacterium]
MKSPLETVKEKYGDKAKLVAAIEKLAKDDLWLERKSAGKGLAHVANAKLLHLVETFSAVKEKFGSRAKLVDAILELEKRTKDEGYKTRLEKYPVPRLWDMYRSLDKRHGAKSAAKASAKPAKKAAASKGKAKAAPKAKAASKA